MSGEDEGARSFDNRMYFRDSNGIESRDSVSSGGISASTWRVQHLPSGSDTTNSFNPSQHYYRSSSSASQSSHASTLSSVQSIQQLQAATNNRHSLTHVPSVHHSPIHSHHNSTNPSPSISRQSSFPAFFTSSFFPSSGTGTTATPASSQPTLTTPQSAPLPDTSSSHINDNNNQSNFFRRQFSHPVFFSSHPNNHNRIDRPIAQPSPSRSKHRQPSTSASLYAQRRSRTSQSQNPSLLTNDSLSSTVNNRGTNPNPNTAVQRPSFTSSATSSSFTSDIGTVRRYWRCISCKELDLRQYRQLLALAVAINLMMMVTEILRVLYIARHASHFDHITADAHADHNADQIALILSLVATILTFSNCVSLSLLVLDPIPRLAIFACVVTLLLECIYIVQTVLYFDAFQATRALLIVTIVFLIVQLLTAWLCYRVWEFSFFNYETNAFQTMQSMLSEFQSNGDQFWGPLTLENTNAWNNQGRDLEKSLTDNAMLKNSDDHTVATTVKE